MNIYVKDVNMKSDEHSLAFLQNRTLYCSCGNVENVHHVRVAYGSSLFHSSGGIECTSCGNKTIYRVRNITRDRARVVKPYYEILNDDARKFSLRVVNLSIDFHPNKSQDALKIVKENMVNMVDIDILGKSMTHYKNGIEIANDASEMQNILRGTTLREVSKVLGYEYGEDNCAVNYLDCMEYYRGGTFESGVKNILENESHLQILVSAGIPNAKRFIRGFGYTSVKNINVEGRNPSEILGFPRQIVNIMRENTNISYQNMENLLYTFKNPNILKTIIDIAKDEGTVSDLVVSARSISRLVNNHNYSDIKRLILYLFRDIRMNQGITSAQNGVMLLLDYVNMSEDMETKFERYPKSLKREHDIVMMNYTVKKDEIKQKQFEKIVESNDYIKLNFSDSNYSITSPSQVEDLVAEGDVLNHCLSSYVNDVTNGRCQIYFLRKAYDLNSPLVSVEVRNGNVRQARGRHNRTLNAEERNFIEKWAKEKSLSEDYYY